MNNSYKKLLKRNFGSLQLNEIPEKMFADIPKEIFKEGCCDDFVDMERKFHIRKPNRRIN